MALSDTQHRWRFRPGGSDTQYIVLNCKMAHLDTVKYILYLYFVILFSVKMDLHPTAIKIFKTTPEIFPKNAPLGKMTLRPLLITCSSILLHLIAQN